MKYLFIAPLAAFMISAAMCASAAGNFYIESTVFNGFAALLNLALFIKVLK